jgi:hypothetical protein
MATNITTGRTDNKTPKMDSRVLGVLIFGVMLLLGACVTPPEGEVIEPAVAPPPPSVEVYFYPRKGQSKAQQERDRYECYLWAKEQTGFDPSVPQLAPHQRIVVEPAPGQETAAGAVAGAVIGATTARRGEKMEGAVAGAMAGAIIGAAAESAREQEARRLTEQQQAIEAQRAARLEQQASNYRRAMAACLEGRGYEVR